MIERQGGFVHFTCDACPEHLETDERAFAEANEARRRAHWSAEKVGGEWIHLCPDCRKS